MHCSESTLFHEKLQKPIVFACLGSEWAFFLGAALLSPCLSSQNNVSINFKLRKVAFRYHCLLMLIWRAFFQIGEVLESLDSPLFRLHLESTCVHISTLLCPKCLCFQEYCRLLENTGFFRTLQWVPVFHKYTFILQHYKMMSRDLPFHALRFISWPLKLRGRTVWQNHNRLRASICLSNLKFIKGKLLSVVSSWAQIWKLKSRK